MALLPPARVVTAPVLRVYTRMSQYVMSLIKRRSPSMARPVGFAKRELVPTASFDRVRAAIAGHGSPAPPKGKPAMVRTAVVLMAISRTRPPVQSAV